MVTAYSVFLSICSYNIIHSITLIYNYRKIITVLHFCTFPGTCPVVTVACHSAGTAEQDSAEADSPAA